MYQIHFYSVQTVSLYVILHVKAFVHSLKIVYKDAGAQTDRKIFLEKNHIALLRPVFYICTVTDLSKQVLFKVTIVCSLISMLHMMRMFFSQSNCLHNF